METEDDLKETKKRIFSSFTSLIFISENLNPT